MKSKTLKQRKYPDRGNAAIGFILFFYLFIFLYALYYHGQNYIFSPENVLRFFRGLEIFVVVFSFFVISPRKSKHTFSLKTWIMLCILPIFTYAFLFYIIKDQFENDRIRTYILCFACIFFSFFAFSERFIQYKTSGFEENAVIKKIRFLPVLLNIILAVFVFATIIKVATPVETKTPTTYNYVTSPQEDYTLKTCRYYNEDTKEYTYSVCLYKNCKDVEVKLIGTWKYQETAIMEIPVETDSELICLWTSDTTFSINGTEYSVNE